MHPDDVPLFEATAEILGIESRLDGIHVTAQAGESRRDEEGFSSRGRDGVINAVVSVGGNELAGSDSAERVGAADPLKVDVIEVGARRRSQGPDIGNVVAVC